MNRRLKVGDRVRNIRVRWYHDEPAVVIDIGKNDLNRYYIKYLNILNVSGNSKVSWVDIDDIALDIEYYRNLKIEKILNE